MARNDPQVNLRIPEELKASLDKAALANKRSLTAEIVARLQSTLHVRDEGGIWAKTFPNAAATALGMARVGDELATRRDMQKEQLRERIGSLQTQLVTLDSQALSVQHQILRLEGEADRANASGDDGPATTLRRQIEDLKAHLGEIDARARVIKHTVLNYRERYGKLLANEASGEGGAG